MPAAPSFTVPRARRRGEAPRRSPGVAGGEAREHAAAGRRQGPRRHPSRAPRRGEGGRGFSCSVRGVGASGGSVGRSASGHRPGFVPSWVLPRASNLGGRRFGAGDRGRGTGGLTGERERVCTTRWGLGRGRTRPLWVGLKVVDPWHATSIVGQIPAEVGSIWLCVSPPFPFVPLSPFFSLLSCSFTCLFVCLWCYLPSSAAETDRSRS